MKIEDTKMRRAVGTDGEAIPSGQVFYGMLAGDDEPKLYLAANRTFIDLSYPQRTFHISGGCPWPTIYRYEPVEAKIVVRR